MTKLFFQIMCVTVVQWSKNCLNVQINRVRHTATLFSVSLYRIFFSLWSLFLTLFFLLAFFLYSYWRPCWSCPWINIYFKLTSGVLFWKRDFKCSWSAYWPSLRQEKKPISCHTPHWTVLIYTQHPLVTHWRKLNLPFVHRLNHQYYYPKISTEFALQK